MSKEEMEHWMQKYFIHLLVLIFMAMLLFSFFVDSNPDVVNLPYK